MPDLVTSAGSASANAFVSQDDADTYLDNRLNSSSWSGASDDDKARALIEATRDLSVLNWDGRRVDDTQSLAWPRQLVHDPDDPNYGYFGSTEIPQRVKDATCELALEFLKAGTSDVAARDSSAYVVEESVGPVSTRYAEPYYKITEGMARYPRVLKLIKPLLAESLGSNQVRLVRG